MSDKDIVKFSKFLSLVLRHKPETIGIELDESGWANVSDLITKLNKANQTRHFWFSVIVKSDLDLVVATNNKKRFAYNENQTKIRASQGHSIDIDLSLEPIEPPEFLYHGTTYLFYDNIKVEGLKKMNRQHVHLSNDVVTAMSVGQRHGKPVVFKVMAKQMYDDGMEFYCAENGVWLTDHVPFEYCVEANS